MSMIKHLLSLMLLIALLARPESLLAHAKMNKSVPENGATIEKSISEISLGFTKPMRLILIRLLKLPEKQKHPLTSDLPKKFVKDASLGIEPLSNGKYEVHWRAIGKDGHIMSGKFSFSVKLK